ncbi:MAG: hypothetical protein RIQ89_1410 [Bacteroidota bacterium]|jgi:hypothetical protein
MKKNFFDKDAYQSLTKRFESINLESKAKWGTMNANEMICHCADAIREALGTRTTKDKSSWFGRNIFKWAALLLPSYPKNTRTVAAYDPKKKGTMPNGFSHDRDVLLKLMSNLYQFNGAELPGKHPVMGVLSHKHWGTLMYKHFNHHLTQFGA